MLKNPLFSKIESITEKTTINPPIFKIVVIDFFIDVPKISPKSLTSIFFGFSTFFTKSVYDLDFSFFQFLNMIPTVNDEIICEISNKYPIFASPNKLIPTVPSIKRGPELLVKAKSLSPSSFEQMFFSLKLTTIFAPVGYPLIIPIIIAIAPSPGTLNIFCIGFLKNLPNKID